jgi:translation initiation factor IF-2
MGSNNMARVIEISDMITVGALADKLSLPAANLIAELFKNGVMATINEKIDIDTAKILVAELKLDVELTQFAQDKDGPKATKKVISYSKHATSRPPVVAMMGHVDHGKTSLLDAIRSTDIVAHEAGGITQHISAYQVNYQGRLITFLDTPGHEAFAAIREHGAYLTDVVIIVIAADDGIKPQTLEAIRYAKQANVKMIIAITKVDKEGANVDRVKQQLAEQKMNPEEWGGDTIIVPLSSKTKEGVDKLLDMILLVADIEELKADVNVPGEGLIIESHMEQGRGPVAMALIQQGTVNKNDYIVANCTYAKVKLLEDSAGKPISQAGPSTPVVIGGFKILPEFGDEFIVVNNEKTAKDLAYKCSSEKSESSGRLDMTSTELIRMINQKNNIKELNVVIKADVQGSLTSVIDCLKTLNTDEVAIRVVGTGVGAITENDVRTASASDAIIYGFQVTTPENIKRLVARDKTPIRLFKIIYELLDDAKQELSKMLEPEEITTEVGRLIVRGLFKTSKSEVICGGEVTKGKLVCPALANVFRDSKLIAENLKITNLKHGPTDTKEVLLGEMCGLSLGTTNRVDLLPGDKVEVFTKEIRERSI